MLQAKLVLPLHDLGLLKLTESHLTRASSWGVVTSAPCPAAWGGCSHTFMVRISIAWEEKEWFIQTQCFHIDEKNLSNFCKNLLSFHNVPLLYQCCVSRLTDQLQLFNTIFCQSSLITYYWFIYYYYRLSIPCLKIWNLKRFQIRNFFECWRDATNGKFHYL